MSTPQEFMQRVVAWPGSEPGYVNVHTFRADRKDPKTGHVPIYGKPFRDLPALMDYVHYCVRNPGKHSGVFFCTSTQSDVSIKGKFPMALRNKPNALWLKSIWLDVDIGKENAYATQEEALREIFNFMRVAQLPHWSALVFTGGGFHVYWTSDRPLPRDEWQGYADGLKAAAQKYGLKADLQCTADAARILRVPGTFNLKYGTPRPVILKELNGSYDFEATLGHIKVTAPVTLPNVGTSAQMPTFDTAGWAPRPEFAHLTDNLSAGIEKRDNLPLDPRPMFRQCQHFRKTLRSGGKSDPEPLWMLNLLACTFIEGGEGVAHMLSEKYPGYTVEATDAKFTQRQRYKAEKNLGWPSCASFEAAGAKCQGCPLRGVIRSPLNVAAPVAVTAPATVPIVGNPLPKGYIVGEHGWIYEVVAKRLPGGEVIEELLPLFMSKIRNFRIATDDAGERPKFCFDVNVDMDNWRKVSMLETELATEQKLLTALRKVGVKPYPRNQTRINQFMTSFMAQLDRAEYRANTIPFGWMMDPQGGEVPVGFAYGGKVFMADGTEQPAAAPDPTFGPLYMPKGDPKSGQWWDLLHMVTKQHHPALEALIALSFAGPLLIGTGHYNAIACGWSPESAAHKTTSVHIGLAVWGEPKRTKEKPNATQKGLMRKAGEIRNLPIYWDEISDDKKLDYVRHMLGDMTEGGIGTRLKQDRTAFAYDEWQTVLAVCANKSLTSNILANVKDTDAQLQRLFEFQVDKRDDTMRPHDVSLLTNALDYNYGHIGLQFAKVLGNDPAGMMAFVKQTIDRFVEEVPAASAARFRSAVAAAVWAGASMANIHIGTNFNLIELWDFLKVEFVKHSELIARSDIVAGARTNTVNHMTQFFKTVTRNTLWVERMPVAQSRGRPWGITYQAGPCLSRPDPIHVRCAVTNRVIEISKQRLYEHLKLIGNTGGAIINSLRAHFGAEEYGRIDLSYGSGVGGGRETVITIPVPNGSPFAGFLFKHTPANERPPDVVIDEDFSQDASVTASVTAAVTAPPLAPETASENTPHEGNPTDEPAKTAETLPV